MAEASDALRLFFALWPDDATRAELDRAGSWLHRHWGGRRMRADSLHLTLVFLGSVPQSKLPAILACADAVRAGGFELTLDRCGFWPRNRIGWLGMAQPCDRLDALAAELRQSLADAGTAFDARPFFPHVTLLRNTGGGASPAFVPLRWPVREVALVSSSADAGRSRYDIVGRRALA